MSDEETGDKMLHQMFNVTTTEEKDNIQMVNTAKDKQQQYFAISDRGADFCIVGQNATVVSHTGQFATLVGYDPTTTKSQHLPIVTAYLKAKAQNNVPVLLKMNEAVYNQGSPIMLLSEYQI